MNTEETVRTFTEFFRDRGHQPVEGSSLLPPPGDPVLFTSAGMHPLTPYLTGQPHPLGRRLTGVQRCLRTTDLDELGDYSHLTVFQMIGSWSLGDYDGPQSQRWGLELLCDGFGSFVMDGRTAATSRRRRKRPGVASSDARRRGSPASMSTILVRLEAPETRRTAWRRTPNESATAVSAASVALPSTARALTRTIRAPSWSPPTPGRAEPGLTRMVIRIKQYRRPIPARSAAAWSGCVNQPTA